LPCTAKAIVDVGPDMPRQSHYFSSGGGGVITIELNGVHTTIKYTVEVGEYDGSLPFLDVSFVKLLCDTLVKGRHIASF